MLKAIRHGKALVRVAISEAQQKSDYVLVSISFLLYTLEQLITVLHADLDLMPHVMNLYFNDNKEIVSC